MMRNEIYDELGFTDYERPHTYSINWDLHNRLQEYANRKEHQDLAKKFIEDSGFNIGDTVMVAVGKDGSKSLFNNWSWGRKHIIGIIDVPRKNDDPLYPILVKTNEGDYWLSRTRLQLRTPKQ